MRKLTTVLFFLFATLLPYSAHAILSMELTRGIAGAIPIAVVPFATTAILPQDVSAIVNNDLKNSGRFKVFGKDVLTQAPSDPGSVSSEYFRKLGTDNVVIGKVTPAGIDRYRVSFYLLDMFRANQPEGILLNRNYTVSGGELRALAHHISDLIYERITGSRGIFSTKLAYVVVQRRDEDDARYILEVADQDGYNPRPLLNSPQPIMSPAWAPNGREIAYVSFENRRAGIYLQNVATGNRQLISNYPGINGAPAWSPDGKKIALVLSKTGSPNIYVMDLATRQLTQLTNDFYINTEPAWSPDGKFLLYTSTQSGGPQIYQINLATHAISRITFDGNYNARASYSRDGKSVTMIHQTNGVFNIAILDLDTGAVKVLSDANIDSTSPSIAPNGSMILYDTLYKGINVLGMVSADGSIQLRLPARNGEAQDPAWSPFLS